MYYTYIVRCSDNSLYTGITTDLEKRMKKHRDGTGAKYTASHPITELCAAWQSEDRSVASRLEYYIKTLSKTDKEALIRKEKTVEELLSFEEGIYIRISI